MPTSSEILNSTYDEATSSIRIRLGASDNYFDIKVYGAVGDGVTDDSNALMAAINAACAAGGGIVFVPAGTYHIESAVTIPTTAASGVNQQKPIRITGVGSSFDGTWRNAAVNGGSILDLRYNGEDGLHPAKIDTRGSGTLEIDHLTIRSGGSDDFQILQTTNTTLFVHDIAVDGNPSKSGTSCVQNFARLGGISNTIGNAADAPFQGYGTKFENNYYGHIQTAITFGNYANNIQVGPETISTSCGSSATHGAAYVFDADTTAGDSANFGCQINGTTLESQNYPHMVALFNSSQEHQFIGMGYYDPGNNAVSQFYFGDPLCANNTIIVGFGPTNIPLSEGNATAIGKNTIIDGREAMENYMPYGLSGDQFKVGGNTPWMRWLSTQPGAHVWKWIAGFNDETSLSLYDETEDRQFMIAHGDGHVSFAGGIFAGTDLKLPNVGGGIYLKEGSNATMGTATLVAGTKVVNTTKVTATSRIFITVQSLGTVTAPKAVAVTARTAGSSFTITSADNTDTSVIAWMIVEPA